MQRVHFVWAHPRTSSLTAQIVDSMKARAREKGVVVTELDLYRSNFGPALHEIDEPRWDDLDHPYSEEVKTLFECLNGIDTLFFVFPVWWYSFPAILKGYFDRVWNYGLAYGGDRKVPVKKIRWIALTGESKETYRRKGNDKSIEHMTLVGISAYCGVDDARIEFLYDTIGYEGQRDREHFERLFLRANEVVDEALAETTT